MLYRFGPYVLDVDAYELRRGDEILPVQPKTFALLEYLLANPGRAVSKQELLEGVWPGVTVSEAALSQAVRQVRVALGSEDPEAIVQTVRGRGYKLALPVEIEAGVRQPAGATEGGAAERQLAAILFTDVAGYTALMAESESRGLRVRERHRQVVGPAVERHRGEIIEARGDECLALFSSVLDAVLCALWLKDAVAADPDLDLHLGVHLGDVIRLDGEISGDGVNLARRICELTRAGELCVSAEAWQAIRNQPNLRALSRGPQEFKHVGRPVDVFAVERASAIANDAESPALRGHPGGASQARYTALAGRGRRGLLAAGVAFVALLGWLGRPHDAPPVASVAVAPVPADPTPSLTSLAVLPFADMSPGGSEQYFSDGLAEEILNALAGVEGLHVVARTSSFAFRGHDEDVRKIGATLAAGSLVEGSVRRSGDRIRITAQLIDTASGFHLWSETYERTLEDVFAVQEEIAHAIVGAIHGEVGSAIGTKLVERRPTSLGAYQLFLRGRAAANVRSIRSLREARTLFEAAVAADPGYADAHAALAHTQILIWDYDEQGTRESPLLVRAEASARRAIALDPGRALGHAALGNVLGVRDHDWRAAEAGYRRALALSPGLAGVREQYGAMLLQVGRFEESHEQLLAALASDPLSPVVTRNVGRYYVYAGEPVRAVGFLQRALELNPVDPITPSLLFLAYTQLGRDADALEALGLKTSVWTRPLLRAAGRVLGMRTTAAVLLGPAQILSPCPMGATNAAQFFAYVGWSEAMFRCLEESLRGDFSYAAVNPLFAGHRGDPRFESLLERAGLAARQSESAGLPEVAAPVPAAP